jgi:epoxyqueuosine reductase
LIAIGNSGDLTLAASAETHVAHSEPMVRGAAVWALSRLLDRDAFAALKLLRADLESDGDVRREFGQ